MREGLYLGKLVEHRPNTFAEQLTDPSRYTKHKLCVRHDALAGRVFDLGGSNHEYVAKSALDYEIMKCEQKGRPRFAAKRSWASSLQMPVSTTHDDWCGNHDCFAPT
jgi:hypothetical protein